MFLAPTAEVPVTNLHREEILADDRAAEEICRLHALLSARGWAPPGAKLAGSFACISSTRSSW